MLLAPRKRREHPPAREKLQRELGCLSQKARRVADDDPRLVDTREAEQDIESIGGTDADRSERPRGAGSRDGLQAAPSSSARSRCGEGCGPSLNEGSSTAQLALDQRA